MALLNHEFTYKSRDTGSTPVETTKSKINTMTIKCYHARRVELVINSKPQMFIQGPVVAPLIATITTDDEYKLNLEDIWDCCNNSCWWDREDFRNMKDYKGKFKVEFTDDYSGCCNDDLIVEENGKYHVAESVGWKDFDSFDGACYHCVEHSHWCQLYGKSKQYPIGEACSFDELAEYKEKYEAQSFKCRLYNV